MSDFAINNRIYFLIQIAKSLFDRQAEIFVLLLLLKIKKLQVSRYLCMHHCCAQNRANSVKKKRKKNKNSLKFR